MDQSIGFHAGNTSDHLLEARGLKKYFTLREGRLLRRRLTLKAVDGIDFSLAPGQTLALVGESGCGKTTTARLILRLETVTSGSILFRGRDISKLRGKQLREYRACVQAVFQDPDSSLNPRMRVRDIVAEPLEALKLLPKKQIRERVRGLLKEVGLGDVADLYPHEFSGGQKQRIAIARALAVSPSLIVLDEPVSALDVSIRAQIMNLLKGLQEREGVAYLLIAHNLATVRYMSHRVAVMYLGKMMELATAQETYSAPRHPYLQALLSAALPSHPDRRRRQIVLPGEVTSPIDLPTGCRFHPRCLRAMSICREVEPPLKEVAIKHLVACHLYSVAKSR